MTSILAIETATDACSVAVFVEGQFTERHEIAPRQHSQLLFAMLREVLPGHNLLEHGLDAIAYGCGPGSFTGLRIAASAVQGLAYSLGVPAIAVPTLAAVAQSALRHGQVRAQDRVFCALDARINEVYGAVYTFEDAIPVLQQGPFACAPAEIAIEGVDALIAVGNGCDFLEEFPSALRGRIRASYPRALPSARDVIPLALRHFQRGEVLTPEQVQPLYVRDEITWKKLAEQGKRP